MSSTEQIGTWLNQYWGGTNNKYSINKFLGNNEIEITRQGGAGANNNTRNIYVHIVNGNFTGFVFYAGTEKDDVLNDVGPMTTADWNNAADKQALLASVGIDITQAITVHFYENDLKENSIHFTYDPPTKPSSSNPNHFGRSAAGGAGPWVEIFFGNFSGIDISDYVTIVPAPGPAQGQADSLTFSQLPSNTVEEISSSDTNNNVVYIAINVSNITNQFIGLSAFDRGNAQLVQQSYRMLIYNNGKMEVAYPSDSSKGVKGYYSTLSNLSNNKNDWTAHPLLSSNAIPGQFDTSQGIHGNSVFTSGQGIPDYFTVEGANWYIFEIFGVNEMRTTSVVPHTRDLYIGRSQMESPNYTNFPSNVELHYGTLPNILQGTITPADQEVADAVSGTSIDASVATAANADVAAVANDADDASVTTTSTTALKRFSDDAEFGNANFTKAKKRKVLKNLMKQIVNILTTGKFVMNDKSEFLKFMKPADDSIDLSAKLKDKIEVIKPGSTNVAVNMDEASVYVPFGDGESITFVDSVSGKEFTMGKSGSDFTLTVADSQGGAHSIPPNYTGVADQEGQVYTYVDAANMRETIFVWGSGTASSNSTFGGAIGDPYITTLSGTTYKMDDFTGFVRLLQGEYEGKTFTINAENKLLTKTEIKELLEWRQTKMQGMNFSDNVRFGKFPAYFSKFYVSHGDKYAIIDANSLQVLESNYEPNMSHSIQINQGYVWSEALKTVSRADLTVGELQMSMMSYEDKDIRNGFKLFNMDKLQNRSGALEHPIYVKDMKIRSIRSVVPIKQQTARTHKKISKEEIIENGFKTQHTFKVF